MKKLDAAAVSRRRDQHVDDLAVLVDGPVDVAPRPVDLHVRLVHEPTNADGVAPSPSSFGDQRHEALHPPVQGDVIELDPTLGQQLLEVSG